MKTFIKTALSVAVIASALSGGAAMAHHSHAMFDSDVELELTGVVTRFDYLNPHSWLYIEVMDEEGEMTPWGFETEDPTRLRRIGVGPNFWQPGDVITVKTNPLRDGRSAGFLVGVMAADGTEYGNVEGLEPPAAE